MIEVFKTNIQDMEQARLLLDLIHSVYYEYRANFDLDDCDRILRVECKSGLVEPCLLVDLLRGLGYHAEILPDEIQPAYPSSITSALSL